MWWKKVHIWLTHLLKLLQVQSILTMSLCSEPVYTYMYQRWAMDRLHLNVYTLVFQLCTRDHCKKSSWMLSHFVHCFSLGCHPQRWTKCWLYNCNSTAVTDVKQTCETKSGHDRRSFPDRQGFTCWWYQRKNYCCKFYTLYSELSDVHKLLFIPSSVHVVYSVIRPCCLFSH